MRTSSWFGAVAIIVGAVSAAPAFDGTAVTPSGAVPVAVTRPGAAAALRPTPPASIPGGGALGKSAPADQGGGDSALVALKYAAEGGHPVAQWKLGRMYASGDGVTQDALRAFDYFSKIANAHAEDSPQAPQARIVANAFVQLGQYYLDGIPDSQVKADPGRAREMFAYAASYFGDPDAQYHLAKLYLAGEGAPRDVRYAARWLGLAAHKGQYQAQAMLGSMLFSGRGVPRQAARGLMWLTLAHDSAGKSEMWIAKLYDEAMANASDDDRAMALKMIEGWVQGNRN